MADDEGWTYDDSGDDSGSAGIRQHRFTAPPGATTVLVVRHSESAAEVPGRRFALRDGHGDPELHPVGVRQAELLADRLEHEPDRKSTRLNSSHVSISY